MVRFMRQALVCGVVAGLTLVGSGNAYCQIFGFFGGRRTQQDQAIATPQPRVTPRPHRAAEPTPVPTPFPSIPTLGRSTPGVWNAVNGTAVSYGGPYGGHTWSDGMPVGGVGTGAIELLPDGRFGNATILNNFDKAIPMPGMVMAISTKNASGKGKAALLCLDSARSLIDSKALTFLPAMRAVKALAAWPFMRLDFADPEMVSPVEVRMNAWSPFVPGSEKDSSYPAMILELDLYNPSMRPVAVGAQLLIPNVIGTGGTDAPNDSFAGWQSVRHDAMSTQSLSGILMQPATEVRPTRGATFAGTLFAGVETSGVLVHRVLHRDLDEPALPWWKQFEDSQRPQNAGAGVHDGDSWVTPPVAFGAAAASSRNGASVGCSLNLAPKERRLVPFVVSWNAPAIYPRTSGKPVLHPMTGARWPNAFDVATDVVQNRQKLRTATTAWHKMLMESNYPTALKVCWLNDFAAMSVNSLLLSDGRFMQLPAVGSGSGVAGTLAHRLESNGALAAFFPRFEASELSQFVERIDEEGNVPPMLGNFHEGLTMPEGVSAATGRVDLPAQLTVSLASLARNRGDLALVQSVLPAVTRALVKMQSGTDASVFSVDTPTSGATSYGTGVRVAALRAGAWMQSAVGKDTSSLAGKADDLAAMFGEKLISKEGAPRLDVSSEAVFAAALAGDWMLRGPLHGLVPVLSDTAAKRATEKILSANAVLQNNAIVSPLSEDAHAAQSEVVHRSPLLAQLVAESLYAGVDANTVMLLVEKYVNAMWGESDPWHRSLRYDTHTGKAVSVNASPAAMSSWRIAEAINGFNYAPLEQTVYFRPNLPPTMGGKLSVPLFTPLMRGMLQYDESAQTADLIVLAINKPDGTPPLKIRRIVPGVDADGNLVPERVFDSPLEVKLGSRIPLRRKPIRLELE